MRHLLYGLVAAVGLFVLSGCAKYVGIYPIEYNHCDAKGNCKSGVTVFALEKDGKIYGWGSNDYDQLGAGKGDYGKKNDSNRLKKHEGNQSLEHIKSPL